jgi:hypothetical protein
MNVRRKSSAISRLLTQLAVLREPRHDYKPATEIFLNLDVDRVASELQLARLARERGADDRPPPDARDFDDVEHQIIERIESHKQDAHSLYVEQLHIYDDRLTALNFEESVTVIEQVSEKAVGELIAEAGLGRDELHLLRKRLRDCEIERNHFRERHGLQRPARLSSPGRTILKVGLLMFLFVVEVAINGGFLAKSNSQGLLGGAIQAVSFAALNIVASFLWGLVPIRLINRRFGFLKLLGLLALPLYFAFAAALNLTLAHLREIPPTLADDVGHQVLLKMIEAPFVLDDVNSWAFFGIGLVFSIIAMGDGALFSDPVLGYAALERRCTDAHVYYTGRKAELIDHLREIRDDWSNAMNDAARALTVSRGEYGSIVASRERLASRFAEHQNHIERSCRALLATYREANRKARQAPPPGYWSQPYVLERITSVEKDPARSAEERLSRLIVETQALLKRQVKAIQDAFDAAVQSYHEIDKLFPEN